jgi:hypothetical protein
MEDDPYWGDDSFDSDMDDCDSDEDGYLTDSDGRPLSLIEQIGRAMIDIEIFEED